MASPPPLLLMADSQLLYHDRDGQPLLHALLPVAAPRAAYIGACNGDEPAFYSIFTGAMARTGVTNVAHVTAAFTEPERAFLEQADVILLAGGDPVRGWRAMAGAGMTDVIAARRDAGALLIGVSAGAMQMGTALPNSNVTPFGWVPFVVDAHDEAAGWQRLRQTAGGQPMLGLPTGAGLLVHHHGALESLRGEPWRG